MTIAGRITTLFTSAAVVMGLAATFAIASREYDIQLERLVERSSNHLSGRTDLQIHIYNRDSAKLKAILTDLANEPGIIHATAFTSLGETLADVGRASNSPSFEVLRSGLMTVDARLVSVDSKGAPMGSSLWSSLFGNSQPLYLSSPVFSALNPAQRGHSPEDFYQAMAQPENPGLRQVIGYVHLDIDRGTPLQASHPAILRSAVISALLVLLFALLAHLVSRRITRPLQQLAGLADDVAAGHRSEEIEIKGKGEVQDIARVLNGALNDLQRFQTERDTDRRLLNMKVEERSSQLDERNRELNKAEEEVASARHKLQQLANYDSLTRLPNRRLFTEQLELLLSLNQRNKDNLALLLIDLDDFKRINDSLGMTTGDELLQVVAERLAACVRQSDVVGHFDIPVMDIKVSRLGGDEFIVVLNEVEGEEAVREVAGRLAAALAEPARLEQHEVVVKTSMGIALSPEHGTTVEQLLRSAGTAKQYAKQPQGDEIVVYDREMGSADAERMAMETALRKAEEQGELELHYQPQVDILSGSVIGAEALLRWRHPDLGLVPPATFIPLAEEIGIIAELGDWVLRETCHQLRAFDKQDIKLPRVSINVSALQFNHGFAQRVIHILQASGLSPGRLELGLTEAVMLDQDNSTLRALEELHQAGVYLSVDDFGTGYSPLSYLSHYPIDELKLDRGFLLDCERHDRGPNLVSAIIAMARSLNLRLLVEGVETERQMVFLSGEGASVMQGYLFSPAVPADELTGMLSPWHFMEQVQNILTQGVRERADA